MVSILTGFFGIYSTQRTWAYTITITIATNTIVYKYVDRVYLL